MKSTEYRNVTGNTTLLIETNPPAALDNVLRGTDVFALTNYAWKLNQKRIAEYFSKTPESNLLEKSVETRQQLLLSYTGIHHKSKKLIQLLDYAQTHNQQREETDQTALEVIAIGPSYRELNHAKRRREKRLWSRWFNTVGKRWWEYKPSQEAFSNFVAMTSAQYLHDLHIPPEKRILVLADYKTAPAFMETYQKLQRNKNA